MTCRGSVSIGAFLRAAKRRILEILSPRERRLLRMLVGSLVAGAVGKDTSLREGAILLWNHPQVRAELLDLLDVLAGRIEHVAVPLSTHAEVPLEVHARYTRIEILAAFGVGEGAKVAPWQTGVYWATECASRSFCVYARQDDRTILAHHPLSRLRDQPRSHSLGEPVGYPCRQRNRAPVPTACRERQQRHAVCASAQRRARLLLPGSRHVRQARIRAADGHHLAITALLAGGSLCGVCRRRRLESSTMDGA